MLFRLFRKTAENKETDKTIHGKEAQSTADPYEAEDLAAHRNDVGNLFLGHEDVCFDKGQAGTTVEFYAGLHQVIVHSYCVRDKGKSSSDVERIDIPEEFTKSAEIVAFLQETNPYSRATGLAVQQEKYRKWLEERNTGK